MVNRSGITPQVWFLHELFENEIILNIERCAKKLSIPVSIFHGSNDEAVNVSKHDA